MPLENYNFLNYLETALFCQFILKLKLIKIKFEGNNFIYISGRPSSNASLKVCLIASLFPASTRITDKGVHAKSLAGSLVRVISDCNAPGSAALVVAIFFSFSMVSALAHAAAL